MHDTQATRTQVARQVVHWRAAVNALADLNGFAAPEAWASLERYLDLAVRRSLLAAVGRLRGETDALEAQLHAARDERSLEALRREVVSFRRRFLTVEDVLEFYGDAVNTRTTPKLGAVLRGCDELARQAMESVLGQLGRPVPPVMCFVKKGIGAAILRAEQPLWDGVTLNPAAAVKITRQGLCRPTALIHEAGHQVAAEIGWAEDLAEQLQRSLPSAPYDLGAIWAGWSSEIVADVFAFVHTGYGSIAALHDVVAGDDAAVFRFPPGDPHPIAYLRVLLGTQLCVRSFGIGPWDDLAQAWKQAHPVASAPQELRPLLDDSVRWLPAIAEVCLQSGMPGLRGRSIVDFVDPRRVAPSELLMLERGAGRAAFTSPHWLSTEALRILALCSFRAATEPERAGDGTDYEEWMIRLGGGALAVAA
jgi:hypothetical protein